MLKCPKYCALRAAATAFLCFVLAPAWAENLHVKVVAPDGSPVPNVAVFVRQNGIESRTEPSPGVMDQRDIRFDPHILVVQNGAAVSFPNSDVIAHHVYSFSKPNDFVLPLYKGETPGPVVFEHDGIVTLGCNIHDGMLGYIAVVDTDVYSVTNSDGISDLEVDPSASSWEVSIWSPRIRDSKGPISIVLQPGDARNATFELKKKLRPPHDNDSESVQWDAYD